MDRVFVDTSAWYALVDAGDPDHGAVSSFMRRNTLPLLTTSYVLDETLTLLKARLGHRPAVAFGEMARASKHCLLLHVTQDDEEEAWAVFKQHHDKVWSFTDCTSMAVMNRLGVRTAFALDEHFEQMGFRRLP